MTTALRRLASLAMALGLSLPPIEVFGGLSAVPAPARAAPVLSHALSEVEGAVEAPPAQINATATHAYRYAQHIVFTLTATGERSIGRAVLRFRTPELSFDPIPAVFEPGVTISTMVTHELRGGGLPPFSRVTYWWELFDEAGNPIAETAPVTFDYIDNRYVWREASRGGVTVHWSEGDTAFGEMVLDAALAALPGIAAETGGVPPSNIAVYVYPSREDLISTLQLGGRDWAGGQARPELGAVLIDLPPGVAAPVDARRVIPHELTHLLVYQATQPGYDYAPAWLDEGLATANEASPDAAQANALQSALEEGHLLSFELLCAPFPDDGHAERVLLAYAQSGSLVQYIRNRYGRQGLQALLTAYRDRAECLPGVERALGVTLARLERDWRASLSNGDRNVARVAGEAVPCLALFALAGLALLPMLGGAARRR